MRDSWLEATLLSGFWFQRAAGAYRVLNVQTFIGMSICNDDEETSASYAAFVDATGRSGSKSFDLTL
jgi:hypothetical protein